MVGGCFHTKVFGENRFSIPEKSVAFVGENCGSVGDFNSCAVGNEKVTAFRDVMACSVHTYNLIGCDFIFSIRKSVSELIVNLRSVVMLESRKHWSLVNSTGGIRETSSAQMMVTMQLVYAGVPQLTLGWWL